MSDIDHYLDELFDRLSGQGAAGRRMLEEAEQHLRMAAADKVADGMPAEEAEREAIARFGESGHVAGLLDRVYQGPRRVTAASAAAAVAGRALLMLAGVYLVSALALIEWGTSDAIMRQTAAVGALLLATGGIVLLVRWLAARAGWLSPASPPYALFGAAVFALAGLVVLVDLPLVAGLAFGERGLHRQAAALLTGLAAVNLLAIGAARSVVSLRARRLPSDAAVEAG
ncbi:permease prefix domain 1-containing protein [Dactylosporangium sp. NPDC048998]|uniref:permease prefix domain 1-containing protein n=1 Tax=Dactylosporangium sp. NPDC048998 TaxID=3363976 RepID=UPI0037168DD1